MHHNLHSTTSRRTLYTVVRNGNEICNRARSTAHRGGQCGERFRSALVSGGFIHNETAFKAFGARPPSAESVRQVMISDLTLITFSLFRWGWSSSFLAIDDDVFLPAVVSFL